MSSIQSALNKMNKNRAVAKTKGDFGEKATLEILKGYKELRGGVIIHSFTYKYASNRNNINYPGNIHRDSSGKYTVVNGNSATKDEIDLVYITPYRIFAIECKARSGTWKAYDYWCEQNSRKVDKSPIAQSEKHARHLYHSIYEYLPDGNPNYIVPLTVFVDKAKVIDSRKTEHKFYLPIAIANNLKKKIKDYDSPLAYELDTEAILKRMMNIGNGKVFI